MDIENEENKIEEEKKEEQAGCLALGFSFLFPIVGVIIYFVNKKNVTNPNTYLYAALAGFVLAIIIKIVSASAGAN